MNLRQKNKQLKRRLISAEELLSGALDLLHAHGAKIGSAELISAAEHYMGKIQYTQGPKHVVSGWHDY